MYVCKAQTQTFDVSDKVYTFVWKLGSYISLESKNNFSAFETLNKVWKDNEVQPNSNMITDISEHLQLLRSIIF